MIKTWKIEGKNIGTGESVKYDWTEGENTRIVEVERADRTGDKNSVIVKITRNTAEECDAELSGQISDGLFENEKVEKVISILYIYEISKEQYERTEYRPLGVEWEEFETENGWNYGDAIENEETFKTEKVEEARDLIVWRVFNESGFEAYIVEVK